MMCFENFSDAVIMDCGHGGLCFDCGMMMYKNCNKCHLCRGDIRQIVRIEANNKDIVKVIDAVEQEIDNVDTTND